MKRIRIGNDIKVVWRIHDNGIPLDLNEYNLNVRMYDAHMNKHEIPYDVTGTEELTLSFEAKKQIRLGVYTLVLELEHKESKSFLTIDSGRAFELVPKTSMAGGADDDDIEVEWHYINSDTSIVIPGLNGNIVDEHLLFNEGFTANKDVVINKRIILNGGEIVARDTAEQVVGKDFKGSDEHIPTTAAMVKHVQEHGDANYLSKVKDDTAKGKITFEIQQQFNKGFKAGNFTPGVADGTGGAMEVSEEGVVTTTTDYLNVRRKARFSEVEILTTHHIGGAQMSSAASCTIDHVVTRSDGVYQCFFRKTDADGRTITNDWKKGDQAYCNTFNLSEQADGTKGNHFFWRLVVSTDAVTGTLTSDLGETFNASEYHCLWIAMREEHRKRRVLCVPNME